MGYPMTWQRIVNRNGLGDGGYDKTPERHQARVQTVNIGPMEPDEFTKQQHYPMSQRLAAYETAFRLLVGDLRRLEADAQDEGLLCEQIARRTGLDADVVAAVLKEFVTL